MDLVSWLPIAGLCFLGAASPGPSLAVVIRHTIQGSRKHGMITGLSHCLGVGFYAFLTVSGISALIMIEPALQKGLAWGGGAYLAYLGYKALRSKGGVISRDNTGDSGKMFEAARDGFLISILNPKLAIFFIALFSQFITPHMHWSTAIIIVLTALLIDGIWYCFVAYSLSIKGFLEKLQKHSLFIDRVTGVVLIGLAIRVLTL